MKKQYTQFRELLVTIFQRSFVQVLFRCLPVKLNRDPGKRQIFCNRLFREAMPLRHYPLMDYFILAVHNKCRGNSQKLFIHIIRTPVRLGKKHSQGMGVPEFIQQCSQKQGQVAEAELKPGGTLKSVKADTIKQKLNPQ